MTTDRFANFGLLIARRKWLVLAVWVVILGVVGGLLAPNASSVAKGGGFVVPGSGSHQASTLLAEEMGASATDTVVVVFHSDDLTVLDEAYRNDVVTATRLMSGHEQVSSVLSYFNTLDERFVGEDGRTTFAIVRMTGTEDELFDAVPELREEIEDISIESYITGLPAVNHDTFIVSEDDLRRSELFTIPIVMILLLIVFRTVISAAIPLVLGGASVMMAMGALYVIGSQIDTSIFALNVASMIGLGLSIDFSLIVVSRFRDERKRGRDVPMALAVTMATAGRSITYSAITVLLSMLALTLVLNDLMIVRSISLGVALVAITGLLAGMTLLPAILAILGHRVEWLRIIPERKKATTESEGIWYRWSHAIMARPMPYLTIAVLILLVLAMPVRELELVGASTDSIPQDIESVVGSKLLEDAFQDNRLTPIQVVVKAEAENGVWTPEFLTALDDITNAIAADPRVARVDSLATYLSVVPRDGRWESLNPAQFDPAPPISAPGEIPDIEGVTIQPMAIVVLEQNPLVPQGAPAFIGLGQFTLQPGHRSQLAPSASLNVVVVQDGTVGMVLSQPAGVIRAANLGNPEAMEGVAPGAPLTLQPGDQLLLAPGVGGELLSESGGTFMAVTMFVVRPDAAPATTNWIGGDGSLDVFNGIQRRVLGGAVASDIPSGPVTIFLERFVAAPNAYLQRHTHPGPELIAIESGTLTVFASPETTLTSIDGSLADVPFDTPVALGAGSSGMVQGNAVHRARNESGSEAVFFSARITDATRSPFLPVAVQDNVAQFVNLARTNDLAVINIVAREGQYHESHQNLVYDLRDVIVPNIESAEGLTFHVSGDAAAFLDFRDSLYGRFVIIVLSVALINFLILMMFFQSILLPVKAIIMNLMGTLATVGVLVLIFQRGWFTSLLGFEAQGMIAVVTPVILYAILFSLSTDYEVFMLSRVKEIYGEIQDNEEAVALGLQQTAGIITAAALILIGTFGSFATARVITIKEIGLGLAFAVLIDATIIRVIMVPATMRLMGDWNWWMPGWLKRFIPEIKEGPSFELEPATAGGPTSWISEPGTAHPVSTPVPTGTVRTISRLRPTTNVLGVDLIPLSGTAPLTIGRDDSNALQLFDMRVSRFHALIEEISPGEYAVVDLGSSNGIFVNGERIAPQPERTVLRNGDMIEIGDLGILTLEFEQVHTDVSSAT
jgi:uncharacterized membrane protein YdfJ with MMPL/SSD domain